MAALRFLNPVRTVTSIMLVTLVASALTVVQPSALPVAATPQMASAHANPIAMPSTITLATDRSTIAAGQVATLVATTDVTVTGTGATVTIVNQTSGATLKTCTSGTTCTVTNGFQTGAPRTYVATVNTLTSSPVVVSRTAWTLSLATSTSVFATNTAVTLTATASQSVSSTSSSYRIYIFDRTLGTLVKSCSTGSTCALTTTPPFW